MYITIGKYICTNGRVLVIGIAIQLCPSTNPILGGQTTITIVHSNWNRLCAFGC